MEAALGPFSFVRFQQGPDGEREQDSDGREDERAVAPRLVPPSAQRRVSADCHSDDERQALDSAIADDPFGVVDDGPRFVGSVRAMTWWFLKEDGTGEIAPDMGRVIGTARQQRAVGAHEGDGPGRADVHLVEVALNAVERDESGCDEVGPALAGCDAPADADYPAF